MIFLEIAMILIGLGAIVLSVKMKDSPESSETLGGESVKQEIQEQLTALEKQFADHEKRLEQLQEERMEDVSDRMSTLSNEKIMGISEYSDQVIDKIEKNHADVVFLYDMLNEKQGEIQALIQSVDSSKTEFQDEMAKSYQRSKELAWRVKHDMQEEVKKIQETAEVLRGSREEIQAISESLEERQEETPEEIQPEKESGILDNLRPEEMEALKQDVPDESETVGENRNDEILALYKKGHSVLEISKMLELGQGEVKFVIDMYA